MRFSRSLIIKLLFKLLAIRNRDLIREIRAFAAYLEQTLFPRFRDQRITWVKFSVASVPDRLVLESNLMNEGQDFPGTGNIARFCRHHDLDSLRFDIRLESNQVVEALLVLLYAFPELKNAHPMSLEDELWGQKRIAAALLTKDGLHRFCQLMRYQPAKRQYEVEYPYCEMFFSHVVTAVTHCTGRSVFLVRIRF
ncbi:hypothetical protein ACFL17_07895 [Pseudomonadota bacterium]